VSSTDGARAHLPAPDRNGNILLAGVEPLTDEQLRALGHRWRNCPDFTGAGLMVGESTSSMLTGQPYGVPVVGLVCRCGAVALVPLVGGGTSATRPQA
jgi:hypothetical protein